MIYYNSPETIEENFSNSADKSMNNIYVNWHIILVSCGLIDIDSSTRDNTVCVIPMNQNQHDDLKQKVEWLRPYYAVDPLVANVIVNMDIVLMKWKNNAS